jgi:hypothetical protein
VAIVTLSLPVSVLITLLLLPLWRWIEGSYGLESIGHSGPAEWCYVATFLVITSSGLGVFYMAKKMRGKPGSAA